jgi:TolA-binding protein
MSMTRKSRIMVLMLALGASLPAAAQQPPRTPMPSAASQDFQASRELERALELMKMNEEERGIKMLQALPNRFPNSKVRFEALVVLGKHYVDKKQYAMAIKQFNPILDSGNDVMRAEALYEIGKCNFYLNQFNQAFSFLRTVTVDYPNSVFANQAYYYIGMCHFEQKHWKKAIDALRMVGTAVSQDDEATRYTEAGQRFFIKIHDLDLVVLARQGRASRWK